MKSGDKFDLLLSSPSLIGATVGSFFPPASSGILKAASNPTSPKNASGDDKRLFSSSIKKVDRQVTLGNKSSEGTSEGCNELSVDEVGNREA